MILIELRQALNSYQDYHMLSPTLADHGIPGICFSKEQYAPIKKAPNYTKFVMGPNDPCQGARLAPNFVPGSRPLRLPP